MAAYYNEFDKQVAQWLRNLIAEGLIAPGDVDDRSIIDVSPDDLRGYTQCHFFAGVGVWSYALRRAGWDDSRPIWTGSCPCQPFSQAGAGAGFDDERHLWPAFAWLIGQCRPPVIAGEQVASKAVDPWVDLVHADLEGMDYAFACIPFPSAGVGAPHIRDRTFWLGDTSGARSETWIPAPSRRYEGLAGIVDHASNQHAGTGHRPAFGGVDANRMGDGTRSGRREKRQDIGRGVSRAGEEGVSAGLVPGCPIGGLANSTDLGQHGRRASQTGDGGNPPRLEPERLCDAGGLANDDIIGFAESPLSESRDQEHHAEPRGGAIGLADTDGRVGGDERQQRSGQFGLQPQDGSRLLPGHQGPRPYASGDPAGPTNGFWRDVDWLGCRDGKWRPVGPGTFPLVNGAPSRVVRLRAYGNAINAEAAIEFIGAYLDGEAERLARRANLITLDELI